MVTMFFGAYRIAHVIVVYKLMALLKAAIKIAGLPNRPSPNTLPNTPHGVHKSVKPYI